jgi:hypothetical protein
VNLHPHAGHSVTIDKNKTATVLNCQTCGIPIGWQFAGAPAATPPNAQTSYHAPEVGLSAGPGTAVTAERPGAAG